jgi:hypothetical protein
MLRSFRRLTALALVAASVAFLGVLPRAAAQGAGNAAVRVANAAVMEMHATQSDAGAYIDPLIGNMPQLSKPPFSAYNSYRLLDSKTLPLEKGKSSTFKLVNNRVLQVTFIDMTDDKRFHVASAINQPGGTAFLKLLEVKAAANETFFVGGQSYKGGALVLAITMKP